MRFTETRGKFWNSTELFRFSGEMDMMTLGLNKTSLTAPILAIALAGCANGTQPTTQQGGAIGAGVIGAVAGGLLGTQVGKGRGRTAAIIAGTILGGAVGSAIGSRLTQQDQILAQQATQRTLETAPVNQPVQWQNPQTGARGEIVATTPLFEYAPVSQQQPVYTEPAYTQQTYTQPAYTQPAYTQVQPTYTNDVYTAQQPLNAQPATATQSCREYKQTIVIADQIETATGTACRQPDGTWKIVS